MKHPNKAVQEAIDALNKALREDGEDAVFILRTGYFATRSVNGKSDDDCYISDELTDAEHFMFLGLRSGLRIWAGEMRGIDPHYIRTDEQWKDFDFFQQQPPLPGQ